MRIYRDRCMVIQRPTCKIIILSFWVSVLCLGQNDHLSSGLNDKKTTLGFEEKKVEVNCSKNIEVFCTLINLTDYWEKRHTDHPLALESRERFLPFKDHRAVKMIRKLLNTSWIWHQFFCHLGLYYSDFSEAKAIHRFQLTGNSFYDWMIKKIYRIESYVSAIRDFYRVSEYEKYWQEKKGDCEELKENLEVKITGIDVVKIMEEFYGMKKDRYFIVPAPQMPSMALNVPIESEGRNYAYAVFGPWSKDYDEYISQEELVEWAFHEFGHTFVEPIFARYKGHLKKHSDLFEGIRPENREKMKKRGYEKWDRIFIENLLRAIQAHLAGKIFGEEFTRKIIDEHVEKGFQLVPVFYELIIDYEKNRDRFPRFESFFPNLSYVK